MTISYRITIHAGDGSVIAERQAEFADDDDAIDATTESADLHEVRVWQGERLVVLFTCRSGLGKPSGDHRE
jgi:hypothetical protein